MFHVRMLNCDITDTAITEMWWVRLHNLSAVMHCYRLFKKGRQRVSGREGVLYVKEQLEGM